MLSACAAWHQIIKWYQFVWNDDVRRLTKHLKLTAVILSCQLTLFGHYAHGRQCRCQEDPVSLPSGRLEKTTRSSPHHVAQHRPTGSETTLSYVPRCSRFGSEPPSVEDDVDVWRCAILELRARNDDDDDKSDGDILVFVCLLDCSSVAWDTYWPGSSGRRADAAAWPARCESVQLSSLLSSDDIIVSVFVLRCSWSFTWVRLNSRGWVSVQLLNSTFYFPVVMWGDIKLAVCVFVNLSVWNCSTELAEILRNITHFSW